MLDELDKELEKRGHSFCRYADDCNIYVRSLRSGERVLASLKQFLHKRLRLKVNEGKSAVAEVSDRQFLGFRLLQKGQIIVSRQSMRKVKDIIRRISKRNRGRSLETVISDLNKRLDGWANYFKLIDRPDSLKDFDGWIRRRLRCYRLKQRKRSYSIAQFLIGLEVSANEAWNIAKSGKGWWRLSAMPPLQWAMTNAWFEKQGLISLVQRVRR